MSQFNSFSNDSNDQNKARQVPDSNNINNNNFETSNSNNFQNSSLDKVNQVEKQPKQERKGSGLKTIGLILGTLVISGLLFGVLGFGGGLAFMYLNSSENQAQAQDTNSEELVNEVDTTVGESSVVDAVNKSQDSVVSVIITQEVSRFRDFNDFDSFEDFRDFFRNPGGSNGETQEQQVGAGSGFIVTEEGHIVTNKHVVGETNADYTVIFNNGEEVEAEVLARDPILDIAFLKINTGDVGQEVKPIDLADSDQIQVGQEAIAIGNSLGQFSNTVSKGIVSGLGREIVAGGLLSPRETLSNLIQTDASINPGNSGGPLLDIAGNVIGVNVAKAEAENIGFAIPINSVKPILNSVIETGEISRPFIGVSYIPLTAQIAEENNLPVENGSYVTAGEGQRAVVDGSPADRANVEDGDIITKVNGEEINQDNTLVKITAKYKPGDIVTLTVLKQDNNYEEQEIELEMAEFPASEED
jgi:serine protease Do